MKCPHCATEYVYQRKGLIDQLLAPWSPELLKLHMLLRTEFLATGLPVQEVVSIIMIFFEEIREKCLTKYIKEHVSLKINFEAFGLYIIPEKEVSEVKSFNTANKVITPSSDCRRYLRNS
ncbi:hypothetical protein NQ315_003315 [Exocentrus adspersus]|uniref:Uncharacterized protein n=1 Tax=Exocentrus adspersus TaxID=1586481 RepID=A0AAV8VAC7_9CUCU|nr:hypothetical protein NQ315_003315 [Exocentrus adspersus]